jgi:hypothetical protein
LKFRRNICAAQSQLSASLRKSRAMKSAGKEPLRWRDAKKALTANIF